MLHMSVVPDDQKQRHYKPEYVAVKILGSKCIPTSFWDDNGEKYKEQRYHDYVCQAHNSTATFPANEKSLFPIIDSNVTLKNFIEKKED